MLRLPVRGHPGSLCLAGALTLILTPGSVRAADADVCATCEHTTIAAGIRAASPGDTVWVAPGSYFESITLSSNYTIRSTGGSAVTHWFGTAPNVVTITAGDDTVIDGFSIHPWDGRTSPQSADTATVADTRGLQISDATVYLEDIQVSAHSSSLAGSAVLADNANVTVVGSAFTDLSAESGGAIDLTGTSLTLLDSQFTNNTASRGGALRCTASVLRSTYTQFTNNNAANDATTDPNAALSQGGAIQADRCDVATSHDQFTGNTAGLGGHVHINGGELLSEHTSYTAATADVGGALWFDGNALTLTGSFFQGNTAVDDAGALYIAYRLNATHYVDGTAFVGNTSGDLGGAIRMESETAGAELELANTWFEDNRSPSGGGAVSVRGVKYVGIDKSNFLHNESTLGTSGGGAFRGELAAGLAGSLRVSNSYFCRNAAGAGGALAHNTDEQLVELLGSVWVDNSATTAGAFLVEGASFEANNNTFVDNSASSSGSVGVLRSGTLAFALNIVTPTPALSGAIFTSGSLGSADSDYNLWWTSADKSFSGAILPADILGEFEQVGDPLLTGYAPNTDCLDWSFEPAVSSPAYDVPVGTVGVTGGELGGTAFTDVDLDGVVGPVDCDDDDPSSSPGAVEVCDGIDNDCNGLIDDIDTASPPPSAQVFFYDADNDGFGGTATTVSCRAQTRWVDIGNDCTDTDRAINPDATEIWYDGVDQNCDGANDFDQDRDGFVPFPTNGDAADCNDLDAAIQPNAEEIWYDGIDQDCDGANDFDQDGDRSAINDVVPDCDDEDRTRSPLTEEIWYDGIDQNCDGANDFDQDSDGQRWREFGGEDCDDQDSTIFLDADERWYDGVDQDCEGDDDYDQDGDGFRTNTPSPQPPGSEDCDDEDDSIFPDQREIPNDGIDQDCSGFDFVDVDGDGFADTDAGGDDCNDDDGDVNPSVDEIPYDAIDQDCDGADLTDVDGDGFDSDEAGGEDCDDTDPDISPDAEEIWYDGIDQDCDGANDYDQDGDSWVVSAGDCDDRDPQRNPGMQEEPNSGVDLNCNGYVTVSRVTGTGCASIPHPSGYTPLWLGLLALGFRRRQLQPRKPLA